jgi:hypothetical protein
LSEGRAERALELSGATDSRGQHLELRLPAELSVNELVEQARKIEEAVRRVMVEGEHYGTIPGVEKPSLWKPGAEKLCRLFQLDPQFEDPVERFHEDGHYSATVRCTLWHIPSGMRVASGLGSCTSRESKYAYRQALRRCPACGAEAIIKGRAEYGGGWLCFKKKGGCGARFKDGEKPIVEQEAGRIANPDLPDTFNTVLKMAAKRALVAAVLNGTAASDIFADSSAVDPRNAGEATEEDVAELRRLAGLAGRSEVEIDAIVDHHKTGEGGAGYVKASWVDDQIAMLRRHLEEAGRA